MKTIFFFLEDIVSVIKHLYLHPHSFSKKKIFYQYLKFKFLRILKEIILKQEIRNISLFHHDFTIRSMRDFIHLYKEIFIREEYGFQTENQEPLIIDIGANIGLASYYFSLRYPQGRIISIEPDPFSFKLLKQNLSFFPTIDFINKALNWNSQDIDFYIHHQSSLNHSLYSSDISKEKIQICTITLEQLIKEKTDFLKMDIEGAEQQVFRNLENNTVLQELKQGIIEYHHYFNKENHLGFFFSLLEENGFACQIKGDVRKWPVKEIRQDIKIFFYSVSDKGKEDKTYLSKEKFFPEK